MSYTFANFVVGSSNQFAHAAALAVANHPGGTYNPLFLYGGVGLGKTHLVQAISQHMAQEGPTRRVICLPAERFVHELVSSLQQDTMESFRSQYRQVDALLVDDVQFLAGKDRSQEEFFHTFNALYEAGKQIVLTSDKSPQDITPLQERLRSRFTCGLMADIQPPDLETRVAILHRKAEERGIPLPTSAAMLVATHMQANVRELEGCLARLGAYASLRAQDISTELTAAVLLQFLSERERAITAPRIQQAVAQHFGVKTSDLRSKKRQRRIAFPRQVAMFLCRELTSASLPEIGRHFGGKDHTTVLHACTKIARLEESDEHVARILWQLRQALGG
ncbi:MAG TPA: chromosomal replication initiator protein DnaA [Candidatus Tectomicrobia bacterium]|jgi:chromosomal replication initiator protein